MIITSTDNNTVKKINKLKDKKYREEYGEFIVEGYRNVLDTCVARPELVSFIAVSEGSLPKLGKELSGFEQVVISDRVYQKLSDTGSGQGIISVHKMPELCFPQSDRVVLLDRVRDPGNVGTIIRTAVACEYDVVANNCADVFSPKTVRSAMSAVVKCRMGADIAAAELKKAGYEIIVADMHGQSVFSAGHSQKYCVVIGNEGDGVSNELLALADRRLSIPQRNIESLNASVAAGVMMFALRYAAK